MLSSPIPSRDTIRSRGAASITSAVTLAQLVMIASTSVAALASEAGSLAGATISSQPAAASVRRSISKSAQA